MSYSEDIPTSTTFKQITMGAWGGASGVFCKALHSTSRTSLVSAARDAGITAADMAAAGDSNQNPFDNGIQGVYLNLPPPPLV